MPIVLHQMANATQLLAGLEAVLSMEGGDALFEERAEDLARASLDVEDLGWVLAVLGSAVGADLLLARRQPRGLEILLPLVAKALRRAERPAPSVPRDLPQLAPAALDGWQTPWAVASLLLAAGEDAQSSAPAWELTLAQDGWRLAVARGETVIARAPSVVERLPGAHAEEGAQHLHLVLPASWLLTP
jgi:hypothetical protein